MIGEFGTKLACPENGDFGIGREFIVLPADGSGNLRKLICRSGDEDQNLAFLDDFRTGCEAALLSFDPEGVDGRDADEYLTDVPCLGTDEICNEPPSCLISLATTSIPTPRPADCVI